MQVVKELQRQYMELYLTRMQWIGVNKTEQNLNTNLLTYLRPKAKANA